MKLMRIGCIAVLATAGCSDDGGTAGGDDATGTGAGTMTAGTSGAMTMSGGGSSGVTTAPMDTSSGDDDVNGSSSSSSGGTSGSSGSSGSSSSSGAIADCDAYMGQATPAETALTPRPDAEAENLAYEATAQTVAPQPEYDRIVADLAAIRAANAAVAAIFARPSWQSEGLIVGFDPTGVTEVQNMTYTAWDCPNQLYKVTNIDTGLLGSIGAVVLTFDGRYNAPDVAIDYSALVNTNYAEPNFLIGDGNDVCVEINGDEYKYIFDAGSGDCPAGCINHSYWGFTTDALGNITTLGIFTNIDIFVPARFTNACTQWL